MNPRVALLVLATIAGGVAMFGAGVGWFGAWPWNNPALAAFYVLIGGWVLLTLEHRRLRE